MSDEQRLRPVPAWEFWRNPILIRYARSRLRLRYLIPWALFVGIAATFIFLFLYTLFTKRVHWEPSTAARVTLIPMLVLQSLLLMLLGTGQVAAGIVQEHAEGMNEYQRLTPMTPMAKIVGYLFGLPIREYLLTLLTVPFVCLGVHLGELPWTPILRFYGVFLSSVLLYHLTGLVAGTVVKRKFLAGRSAQMLVVLLYLVLPRFAEFGLVFLIYLTILPTFREQSAAFLPDDVLKGAKGLLGGDLVVPWFQWSFSPTHFSYIVQGGLIFVLVVVLIRKWRDPESHLLGHYFAVMAYGCIALLLLGNAIPLIDSGQFLSFRFGPLRHPPVVLAVILFGTVLFTLALCLVGVITPNHHETLRGYRRAKKLDRKGATWWTDDASAQRPMVFIAVIGMVTWIYLTRHLMQNAEFAVGTELKWFSYLALAAAFILPLFAYQTLFEHYGWRVVLMAFLFVWTVPPLFALILGASGQAPTLAIYLPSLSGFVLPVYAATLADPSTGISTLLPKVKGAFMFSITFYAVATPWLWLRLHQHRQILKAKTGLK